MSAPQGDGPVKGLLDALRECGAPVPGDGDDDKMCPVCGDAVALCDRNPYLDIRTGKCRGAIARAALEAFSKRAPLRSDTDLWDVLEALLCTDAGMMGQKEFEATINDAADDIESNLLGEPHGD